MNNLNLILILIFILVIVNSNSKKELFSDYTIQCNERELDQCDLVECADGDDTCIECSNFDGECIPNINKPKSETCTYRPLVNVNNPCGSKYYCSKNNNRCESKKPEGSSCKVDFECDNIKIDENGSYYKNYDMRCLKGTCQNLDGRCKYFDDCNLDQYCDENDNTCKKIGNLDESCDNSVTNSCADELYCNKNNLCKNQIDGYKVCDPNENENCLSDGTDHSCDKFLFTNDYRCTKSSLFVGQESCNPNNFNASRCFRFINNQINQQKMDKNEFLSEYLKLPKNEQALLKQEIDRYGTTFNLDQELANYQTNLNSNN